MLARDAQHCNSTGQKPTSHPVWPFLRTERVKYEYLDQGPSGTRCPSYAEDSLKLHQIEISCQPKVQRTAATWAGSEVVREFIGTVVGRRRDLLSSSD